jgi:beta-lactam-binding protein with PASTA domain
MPDLSGMTLLSAQSALARVGIKTAPPKFVDVAVGPVGSAGTMPKLPTAPGSIIAQLPPAGSRVDQTTQVKLTVAK